MSDKDLIRKVKARIRKIQKNQIWSKAFELAKKFGKVKRDGGSDWSSSEYTLEKKINGNILNVFVASGHWSPFHMRIHWNSELVFSAGEKSAADKLEPHQKLSSFKLDNGFTLILVEIFSPGEWEKWINPAYYEKYFKNREAENRKAQLQQERQQRKELMLHHLKETAQDLGIK